MKNIVQQFVCILLIFSLFNVQGYAKSMIGSNTIESNQFDTFNEEDFYSEFEELQELESILAISKITLSELQSSDFALNVSLDPEPFLPFEEEPVDYGGCNNFTAFLMGVGCGAIGVLIVYLKTDNRQLTNQAIFGCVVSTVLSVVMQVSAGNTY